MIRTRNRASLLRRRRPRRGTPRLLADLAAVARLQSQPALPARERLAVAVGSALACELDGVLSLEGRLRAHGRGRGERRRAA